MKTLILAAGTQSRWRETGGKGLKQLIKVHGETLVERIYRLASERTGGEVITVVRDPADPAWKGVNPQPARHEEWMGEMGKFLDHQHLWGDDEIVVLWGDAYYTEATLDRIFEHVPTQPTIYGRANGGRDRRLESFGMRWKPEHRAEVVRIAEECADAGLNKQGGPWRWFLRRHTGTDRYSSDLVKPLATEANGWVEVGTDETDDFDRLPQLALWRGKYGLQAERSDSMIVLKHSGTGRTLQVARGSKAADLLLAQGWVAAGGTVKKSHKVTNDPPALVPEPAPEPAPAPTDSVSVEDEPLETYSRAQLDARAIEVGIETPKRYRTKGELIEAILATAD